jgi:hypothetical protein
LRLNGNIAKQRSEATRIAQESLENSRDFQVIDTADVAVGEKAWEGIVDSTQTVAPDNSNTTYTVARAVTTLTDPPAKALSVTVTWTDRAGQNQQVTLTSRVAAAAPALSGTLNVRTGTSAAGPVRRPLKRHPSIPVQAKAFPDGRSAFVPPGSPWVVLVFNNVSGLITSICDFGAGTATGLTNDNVEPTDVESCEDTLAQLLSGFVRFWRETGGSDLTAADVENPPGPALRLHMQITLTSSGHPSGSFCVDDASYASTFDGLLAFASYFCVIKSNSSGLWAGRTEVRELPTHIGSEDVDWEISDSAGDNRFRVCRYTPAASDAAFVPNAGHPRNYANVSGNLTDQNFVVIPSVKHCPTDVAANPAAGDLVNSNTLQHQPAP